MLVSATGFQQRSLLQDLHSHALCTCGRLSAQMSNDLQRPILCTLDGDEQLGRLELPEPVMSQLLEVGGCLPLGIRSPW